MENDSKFNPQSVGVKLFEIDGVLYESFNAHYSSFDAELLSKESSRLPKGTVRFIGQIPWKVDYVVCERGYLKNFLVGFGFHRTFTTKWVQVLPPILSQEQLIKAIVSKIV